MSNEEKEKLVKYLVRKGLAFLISEKMFQKPLSEVLEILDMPEWYNPLFRSVFHKNMWRRSYKEIKAVLNLEIDGELAWNRECFQKILIPTIWKYSVSLIKSKLELPFWRDPRYQRLFCVSILSRSSQYITDCINYFESVGLIPYITFRKFRSSLDRFKAVYNYLRLTGVSIVIDGKLNEVFYYLESDEILLNSFGINIDYLLEREKSNGLS